MASSSPRDTICARSTCALLVSTSHSRPAVRRGRLEREAREYLERVEDLQRPTLRRPTTRRPRYAKAEAEDTPVNAAVADEELTVPAGDDEVLALAASCTGSCR